MEIVLEEEKKKEMIQLLWKCEDKGGFSKMAVVICQTCGGSLILTNKGWRHKDGSLIKQRCENCGWYGGGEKPFSKCPKCGSGELRDDHMVEVVWVK